MKLSKFISIFVLILLFLPFFGQISLVRARIYNSSGGDFSESLKVTDSCTIFTVNINETVFFGNNEDFRLRGTYMWLYPTQYIYTPSGYKNTYGTVAFGFNHNDDPLDGAIQGGMNDQGLSLDVNGLPEVTMNAYPLRERIIINLLLELLLECKDVSEVINWFQSHSLGGTWGGQLHVADAAGNAIVVSVVNREFVFTNKSSSHYLVSTNFNVADRNNGYYPCNRYNTATNMLAQITKEEDLNIEACRDVLDAVHQDGQYGTKYSNIFDLVNQKIYLYYNRDFYKRVSLDLDTELADVHLGGDDVIEKFPLYYKEISIASLFPENPMISGYPLVIMLFTIAAISFIFILVKRKPFLRIKTLE